jgi:hypothetical protein
MNACLKDGTGRIQVDVSWPPRWIERWNDGHWQFASLTDAAFRASWRQSLVPLVPNGPVLDRVRAILRIGPVLDRVPSTSVSSDSSSDSHPPIAADPTSRVSCDSTSQRITYRSFVQRITYRSFVQRIDVGHIFMSPGGLESAI